MANNPITQSLPADLPVDWAYGQTVAPTGAEAGLSEQHGYNYLMEQVNAAQRAASEIGEAFGSLSPADIGAASASSLSTHTGNAAIHRASSGLRLTLTTAGWTGSGTSYSQTVNAAGVTTAGNEVVLVYPANKASRLLWQDNGVAANDITTNGKLTFEAESKPTAAISVIVEVKDIGLT